ncbi:cytochrome P450 [Byssothecium circinans]|uniref:Cytochrome P450 n=1 Tax=Byssothecium circinans TaxID=147558 RepID=A0A6A5UN31_9PLEO|nr:cytochrome P450 [Byssothecium circinans]
MSSTSALSRSIVLCLVFAICMLYKILRFGSREKHLPRGPPTVPILGNAHLIPKQNLYRKIAEWSQYKNGANYLSRAREKQSEVALNNESFAMMHATLMYKAHRKIAMKLLSPARLDDSERAKVLDAETIALMNDLLSTPEDFSAHVKRSTASMASIPVYGQRATSPDTFWATINNALEPGSYFPVEQFPFLKFVPSRWNPGPGNAFACSHTMAHLWSHARQLVEARRDIGDHRDCIMDKFLSGEVKNDVPMSDAVLNHFCGTLLEGATSTTAQSVHTNLLFLGKYPEVQKRAREDLDRACGIRIPAWSDFDQLPIRPTAPVGVPHSATKDDWYKGMLIPAGSTVLIPSYALNHTSAHYSGPSTYNPSHYLHLPNKLATHFAASPDYSNRDHYTYGAGRRICVGIHLAERTQWMIMARVLWGFIISPAVDGSGNEIELDIDAYTTGLSYEPLPFKLMIVPRSEEHAELIWKEFKDVDAYLREWE